MVDMGKGPGLDSSYDVVVVGAGNGGLSAALALAVNGVKPLLLEQHNIPGGFATSFVRGRFEFEASLHELSEVGPADNPGGVRTFLGDEAGLDIDWVRVPEAYRLILTDKDINVRVPFGIDEFIDTLANAVPGSRDAVTKYMEYCKDISEVLGYMARVAGNPDPAMLMSDFAELMKNADKPVEEVSDMMIKFGNFIKSLPRTAQEVIDTFDLPEKVIKIISPYWCYLGIPMTKLANTIWVAMLINYLENGAYLPKMRSNELAKSIDARIRELGGHIEYNTRVEKIIVEKNRIKGVETHKGDVISTENVIANVSPTLTYNKLIYPKNEVPDAAYRYVNARAHGPAGYVVYLGLDTTAEKLGMEDYGYFISTDMDTDQIVESMKKADLVDMQATICLNNAIPDCSPPGTCILSMTTLYEVEAWDNVKAEDYFKLKNDIANKMITQFENAMDTKIRDNIEEIEVATPQTFARYTRTFKGSIYGYKPEPWDFPVVRVMTEKDEKYIKGLEVSGGYACMGAGYSPSITSGRMAGMTVLEKLG